jgi:sulfopyruvate decarboxylase subunit alpha
VRDSASALVLEGLSPGGLEECALARSAPGPFLPGMMTDLFHELGVTHVVTVPDNTSAPLLASLEREGGRASGSPIRVVYATREGEAVALAAGLWLGGATPVVLIQNTGLLEAGDGLRGTASRMGAPLLLLVTLRGYGGARRLGVDPAEGVRDRQDLVRPELDTVALMTEGTLDAWGIPFFHAGDGSHLSPVRLAWEMAVKEERPVAVLLERVRTPC